jgi:uncharacterized protein (TIGR02266 family)
MGWPEGPRVGDLKRRRHERLPAHLPVRLATIDAETDRWTGRPFFRSCREWSANVSRGGLFIPTPEAILPGRRVLVEVTLPGGETIEAVGRVAWTRRSARLDAADAGIGLQFVGAAAESIARLEDFLRRRSESGPHASA